MYTVYRVLESVVNFYSILIIVYCFMSWIPRGSSKMVEEVRGVLASLCEPYLGLFRRFIPPIAMIDFSPIVAILALGALTWLLRVILL
ncbi:MAG: YggT family protein [Coriobacteriales bacterium]|jgi:YggT family protein